METIEDLMVGEEADFQRTVNKAFMQCPVDRSEKDRSPFSILTGRGSSSVCYGQILGVCAQIAIGQGIENISQTCRLLLAVSKDIELVTLEKIVAEGPGQEFKVLVEKRLRGDIEADCRPGAIVLPCLF